MVIPHSIEMASRNIPASHGTGLPVLCYESASQRSYPDMNTLYSSWHQEHVNNGKTSTDNPPLPVTMILASLWCSLTGKSGCMIKERTESTGAQVQVIKNMPSQFNRLSISIAALHNL